MSQESTLDELRENARTNYGITNADDLDAKTLQSEMDAIDKQAEDAKDEEAKVQRNADRANANSTAPAGNGASDGNTTAKTGTTTGDENDSEKTKPLAKQTKAELLETAKTQGVEVEETDTVPVLREKIAAASADSDNDREEIGRETPEQLAQLPREELEGRAREAGVDGDPSDTEQYPDTDSLVTAIETARASK